MPLDQSHAVRLLPEVWSYPTTSPRLLMPMAAPPRSVGSARGRTVKRPRSYTNHRDGRSPAEVWMVPTTAPQSFMPNTRGILKSWLGRPGGTPKLVSTPLDHSASETDPSELAIPPATTPLLLRASPPVPENGMKGSGVTSYRSAAKQEFMVSRCSMAFQFARSVYSRSRAQFCDERPCCAHRNAL